MKLFKKKAASLLTATTMLISSLSIGSLSVLNASAADKSRVSVHDPSIYKSEDGTYYVFGSHIDAAKSTDLQNWTTFTNGYTTTDNAIFGDLSDNLKKAFEWAGEDLEDCEGGYAVWAPDVIYNPDYINEDGTTGAYLMYFCTSSTYKRSVIGFASSQNVEGPYTFVDTLIYSGFTEDDSYVTSDTKNVNIKYTSTNVDELIDSSEVTYNTKWFSNQDYNNSLFPNAIDPTIYYDTDGKMYMCYGSWSGGIFTLEIDKQTGKCIHPETSTTDDGRMIDSYFGTKISGGYYKSGEGPFIEYNSENGYYYLWVTYGGLVSEGGYNMRVFRSESPTGPFYDQNGNPAVLTSSTDLDSVGLKVMGNYKFSSLDKAYMACGHNSVLCDDDGQWYLFYHARFDDGTEYHQLRVHTMYFNDEDWPVVSPYEYSGDSMAEFGYETSDITGDYEYINHGNSTDGNIISYQNITLNEDGTITGDVTGYWSETKDSSSATINIDNQEYSGYFLAAQDENGQVVMSFTAVGSNNQTIWGAKTEAYTGSARQYYDYTDSSSSLTYSSDTSSDTGESINIGDTSLLSGVSYYISNKNSGLLLDLTDGNLSDSTNIEQWEKNGSFAQQWKFVSVANGYCKIVSVGDESKCIAVAQNDTDSFDGVNIELQTYTEEDDQLWKFVKKGKYYGIVSKCSTDTAGLDVYDWSVESGGNVNQWSYWGGDCQLWNITPVYPEVNSGLYQIKNVNSGLFLFNDNNNLIQSEAQNFIITALEDGTYTITDSENNAITIENSSADDGSNVILTKNTESDSQKFKIICNKDGSYSFISVVSLNKSCLDVYGISTEDGANICQWSYWGGDGQKFILSPVTDTSDKKIKGDVNADGVFDISDIIMLQKYILNLGNVNDWEAGDLYENQKLDIIDLCIMKAMLV